MKRTIFIWDIHWCYDELKLLLKKVNVKKNDIVYFVGDYINKWPKSFKVLKFLYKNREQYKCILWNHDLAFLKWLKWDISNDYWKKTFKKLKEKLEEHPEILEYYKSFPLYIEKENFILIHWWLNPKKKLKEHIPEEITTLRVINKEPWYNFYKWEKKIIYGHWATQWINIRKNVIWLDSGCCYGWYLSAYILETGELIQMSSLDQYSEIDYSHVNPVFQ